MPENLFLQSGKNLMILILRKTLSIIGCLLAMSIWMFAGSVFYRTLDLFTLLTKTPATILATIAGFIVMTSAVFIFGYLLERMRNRKS